MYISIEEMAKAAELTRAGRLHEATETIQRALGHLHDRAVAVEPEAHATPDSGVADIADVTFRETLKARPGARASFERRQFESGGKQYNYWLYQPASVASAQPMPVVVMLHGCSQDGADFAGGTAMNELAARERCVVVYPEQRQDANSMRCWNWFEPAHQQRGAGEPAMIAALALAVASACNGDAARIYVAGLSAGGAMATLVAQLYPDVFAAVGVHSGLPAGSARDLVSALSAMRKPSAKGAPSVQLKPAVPAIVFHGNSDRTVHPANGKCIVQEAVSAFGQSGVALKAQPGGGARSARTVRRTVYAGIDGISRVESWEIVGAPHAWSGGRAVGSYTDPQGPDASAAMLEFFLRHRRAA